MKSKINWELIKSKMEKKLGKTFTKKEMAKLFGISEQSYIAWTARGRLPVKKINDILRICDLRIEQVGYVEHDGELYQLKKIKLS